MKKNTGCLLPFIIIVLFLSGIGMVIGLVVYGIYKNKYRFKDLKGYLEKDLILPDETMVEDVVRKSSTSKVVHKKASKRKVPNKTVEAIVLDGKLSGRQNEILDRIKASKALKMSAIADEFKVSQRTLRRDLQSLESQGLIKQRGKTRNSEYVLV